MRFAIAFVLVTAVSTPAFAQAPAPTPAPATLAERIGHTDPAQRGSGRSHGSLGDMKCQTLVRRGAIPYINFVHRCEMTAPDGGVGHHFHNTGEEMFVVFDGRAEFTIDGRTSVLEGHVVGAPQRLGHSHAIYNPMARGVDFMNIQVGLVDGVGSDSFDLADPRKGATQDALPTFMTMKLDKVTFPARTPAGPAAAAGDGRGGRGGRGGGGGGGGARPQVMENYLGGTGRVMYRRALYPALFTTNWAYVDHLTIEPGASEGLHRHPHVGEIYYVLEGSGTVKVNNETSPITKGDGIPVRPDEVHSLVNNGTENLELMIIGISTQKGVVDTVEVK